MKCIESFIAKTCPLVEVIGYILIDTQAQYSLLCRSTELELLEVCKREGVAMLPWSPLKGYC